MNSTVVYSLCFLFALLSFQLLANFASDFGVETHQGKVADGERRKTTRLCGALAALTLLLWLLVLWRARGTPEPITAADLAVVLPLGLLCVGTWLRTTRFAFPPRRQGPALQGKDLVDPVESALNKALGEDSAKTTSYVKRGDQSWARPLNELFSAVYLPCFAAIMFSDRLGEETLLGQMSLGVWLWTLLLSANLLISCSSEKERRLGPALLVILAFAGVAAGLACLLSPLLATA